MTSSHPIRVLEISVKSTATYSSEYCPFLFNFQYHLFLPHLHWHATKHQRVFCADNCLRSCRHRRHPTSFWSWIYGDFGARIDAETARKLYRAVRWGISHTSTVGTCRRKSMYLDLLWLPHWHPEQPFNSEALGKCRHRSFSRRKAGTTLKSVFFVTSFLSSAFQLFNFSLADFIWLYLLRLASSWILYWWVGWSPHWKESTIQLLFTLILSDFRPCIPLQKFRNKW